MTDPHAADDPDDRTTLSPRRLARAEIIDAVPAAADQAPDAADETVLSPRHVGSPAEGDEPTVRVARDARRAGADDTVLVGRGGTAGGVPIAHGRADTPRIAVVPGSGGDAVIYRPRAEAAPAPVTRMPVAPPTAADPVGGPAPAPRTRRGLLLAVAVGSTVIVGSAITGIMVILTGGS